MKKKLQFNFWVISICAIVAVLLLTTVFFYNLFQNEVMENLETCAHMLRSEADGINQIQKTDFDDEAMKRIRVTLIASSGKVIFDSSVESDVMENHKERPEIQDAIKYGEGKSIRNSATLSKTSFYYAVLLENGDVLRIAKESESFFSFLIRVSPLIGGILLALVVASTVLSHYLAKSFVRPIEKMAKNMDEAQPDLTYKELAPFLTTIKKQHEDIIKNSLMRQEFTANVSHELKTPLTSISGYSELIESGMAKEQDITRFAGEIHKSANRLLTLINDILQLSELDSQDFTDDFEIVDLGKTVTECMNSLQLNAKKRQIELVQKGTRDYFVSGSPKMLEELVYNLIDNAIRYNKESGSVFVTLSEHADQIVLLVKDTGIGISEENQERIFERFYRVDKSRSKETGGTGLGLAIVKHIVLSHGAGIQVKSKEGTGTQIIVTFKKANE